MIPDFRKGQKISDPSFRESLNQVVRQANAKPLYSAGETNRDGDLPGMVQLARNATGAARVGGRVARVEQALDYTANQLELTAIDTSRADAAQAWCVILDDVPSGGVTRVRLNGLALVTVSITNASDTFVALTDGEDYLTTQADASGAVARILRKEAGTGTGKMAMIEMFAGAPEPRLYITTGDIQLDGTISIKPADIVSGQVQAAAGASAITVNAWEY